MSRKRKWRRSGFKAMLDRHHVLQSVADEYDLAMLEAQGAKGVYKINTSQGWKKFKVFKYTAPELEFVYAVLEHLAEKGWKRSLPLHLTREGVSHAKTGNKEIFYVTSWVQGREINSKDPLHLKASANILGEMHRLLEDFQYQGECPRFQPENWLDKYGAWGERLLFYQQQSGNTGKHKFNRRFRQAADDFLRMLGIGLQLMDEADYEGLSLKPNLSTICHTSPIAGNLIVGRDGRVHIIDFDNARKDLRVLDVARLMISLSDWDLDKALFLLRSYQGANPLEASEIALIPALCAIPGRGLRVARSFYERKKAHLGQLEKAMEEVSRQNAFVKALCKIRPGELVYKPKEIFQTIPHLPEPLPPQEDQVAGEIIVGGMEHVLGEAQLLQELPHPTEEEGFYWGDVHGEPLVPESAWESPDISQQLTLLTKQMGCVVQAMRGMGWPAKEEIRTEPPPISPGWGVPVEVSVAGVVGEAAGDIPGQDGGKGLGEIGLVAAKELRGLGPGKKMEVYEALSYLVDGNQREGEVRLNTAADMEDMSLEISAEIGGEIQDYQVDNVPVMASWHGEKEIIEPGVEVPVIYGKSYLPQEPGDNAVEESVGVVGSPPWVEPPVEDIDLGPAEANQDLEEEALAEQILDIQIPEQNGPVQEGTETLTEIVTMKPEVVDVLPLPAQGQATEEMGEERRDVLTTQEVEEELEKPNPRQIGFVPKKGDAFEWKDFPEPLERPRGRRGSA